MKVHLCLFVRLIHAHAHQERDKQEWKVLCCAQPIMGRIGHRNERLASGIFWLTWRMFLIDNRVMSMKILLIFLLYTYALSLNISFPALSSLLQPCLYDAAETVSKSWRVWCGLQKWHSKYLSYSYCDYGQTWPLTRNNIAALIVWSRNRTSVAHCSLAVGVVRLPCRWPPQPLLSVMVTDQPLIDSVPV